MDFKLILGYDCNLKCSYCYQKNNKREMSYEVIDKFLERFNTLKGSHTINFFGGEPLLYLEKIRYIISKIDKRHSISISTNGSFRKEFYELQELWGREISNLLSNKEHKNYFKLNDLSCFRFIVTKENINELTDELIRFLAIEYNTRLQFKYDMSNKWELKDIQKMEQVQRKLQAILGVSYKIELPVNYNSSFGCYVNKSCVFIDYNGNYLACHRMPNSKIGNIFNDDFKVISNSRCLDRYTNKPENLYSYGDYEFKGATIFHSCD